MKLVKILFAVLCLFGSVAFAFEIPGLGSQKVNIDGGKVNVTVTGKNGESVTTDGGSVGLKGKSGESVSTDGERVDVKGTSGNSVSTDGDKVGVKTKYGIGVSVPTGAGK